jgi:hypothetical protein
MQIVEINTETNRDIFNIILNDVQYVITTLFNSISNSFFIDVVTNDKEKYSIPLAVNIVRKIGDYAFAVIQKAVNNSRPLSLETINKDYYFVFSDATDL